MFGLWRKRCHSDVTGIGLSLIQHGQLEKGQEVLGEASRQAALGTLQV